mmetsp:Transcript_1141/g.2955  ORF Transcript_1141/g.2955 Transcript_1141/m.2955 type:complete len:209 (-) Transcript_1141:46-672(-)
MVLQPNMAYHPSHIVELLKTAHPLTSWRMDDRLPIRPVPVEWVDQRHVLVVPTRRGEFIIFTSQAFSASAVRFDWPEVFRFVPHHMGSACTCCGDLQRLRVHQAGPRTNHLAPPRGRSTVRQAPSRLRRVVHRCRLLHPRPPAPDVAYCLVRDAVDEPHRNRRHCFLSPKLRSRGCFRELELVDLHGLVLCEFRLGLARPGTTSLVGV